MPNLSHFLHYLNINYEIILVSVILLKSFGSVICSKVIFYSFMNTSFLLLLVRCFAYTWLAYYLNPITNGAWRSPTLSITDALPLTRNNLLALLSCGLVNLARNKQSWVLTVISDLKILILMKQHTKYSRNCIIKTWQILVYNKQ